MKRPGREHQKENNKKFAPSFGPAQGRGVLTDYLLPTGASRSSTSCSTRSYRTRCEPTRRRASRCDGLGDGLWPPSH